jgi:hypothetical protein
MNIEKFSHFSTQRLIEIVSQPEKHVASSIEAALFLLDKRKVVLEKQVLVNVLKYVPDKVLQYSKYKMITSILGWLEIIGGVLVFLSFPRGLNIFSIVGTVLAIMTIFSGGILQKGTIKSLYFAVFIFCTQVFYLEGSFFSYRNLIGILWGFELYSDSAIGVSLDFGFGLILSNGRGLGTGTSLIGMNIFPIMMILTLLYCIRIKRSLVIWEKYQLIRQSSKWEFVDE